jgi:esterase/lipase
MISFQKKGAQFLFLSLLTLSLAEAAELPSLRCVAGENHQEALRSYERGHGILPEEQTEVFLPKGPIKAVALVMHGLNQKPLRMNEFSRVMADNGIAAVRGVLAGHGGDSERLKTVTREQWLADTHRVFCLADTMAKKHKVSLVGIGFSLGALLITDLATTPEYASVKFDRVFYLAPAITPSWFGQLVKVFQPLPYLVIPSANRNDNRSNFLTPVSAYNALFKSADEVLRRGPEKVPFPALVYIDPQDELVSTGDLQKWVQRMPPGTPWRVELITRGDDALLKDFHHSIFESRFLGKKAWDGMVSAAVDFLLKKG